MSPRARARPTGRPRAGGAGGSESLQRVAARGAQAEGKLQQRFRRLLHKVNQLKERVLAWKQARPDIDTEIARHVALVERMHRCARDMVGLLERSYPRPIFSTTDRRKLSALICSLAGELIEHGGHDELKPLYNHHSRSDFDAEAAAAEARSVEDLRSMMEMFGVDLDGADVGSLDKLRAFSEEQLRAMEREAAAAEERRATRKKSAKQVAAEARREDQRRISGKALQDVYRALALALHPDREPDAAERARKTELMREVNVAYEAKDLLRLLELELELERIEPARASAIAEDRLQHYNQILDEQARQLAVELEELELPFVVQLDVPPSSRFGPANVVSQIRADSEAVRQRTALIERDLTRFEDATRLKAWLKAQVQPRRRGDELGRELDLFG